MTWKLIKQINIQSNGQDSLLGLWLFFYFPNLHFFFLLSHSLQIPLLLQQNKPTQNNNNKNINMLLGKRPRTAMKRTTSLSEITFDLDSVDAAAPPASGGVNQKQAAGFLGQLDRRFISAAAHRRASADFSETAHFLRACSLCRRRLAAGRDIYMYRGDSAFCSLECRQQQMAQDERKEKFSLFANIKESSAAAEGETIAAV